MTTIKTMVTDLTEFIQGHEYDPRLDNMLEWGADCAAQHLVLGAAISNGNKEKLKQVGEIVEEFMFDVGSGFILWHTGYVTDQDIDDIVLGALDRLSEKIKSLI